MSTNYYLLKKTEFNPLHRLPATLGCDDGKEHEPIELINGWVWRKKYYATLEALNNEYYQKIHIGKSSGGWRFLLCIYKNKSIDNKPYLEKEIISLEDWKHLMFDPANKIIDEYDENVSPESMIKIISERVGSKDNPYSLCDKINGLCIHDGSSFIVGMPENFTYDLVWSGNDPDSELIFC